MNLAGVVVGTLKFAVDTVKGLPGGQAVVTAVADVERDVVRVVRQHLDDVDPVAEVDEPETADVDNPVTTAEQALRELMQRSMYDRPSDSAAALHLALISALLPDEARIFAAVSDGSRYPVMHVAEPGVGIPTEPLLRNASTVGRAAGVALPSKTPIYLARMLALGLLTIGPEDVGMRDDYEMLLTDAAVHTAISSAGRGLRTARIIRRTVGISPVGKEVWEAAK